MDFENRLESLYKASAPGGEIDSAVIIYERMVTAKSICKSVIGDDAPADAVVSVMLAICDEHEVQRSLDALNPS